MPYRRLRQKEYESSIRRLDFSLLRVSDIIVTNKRCMCGGCRGRRFLVTWEGRSLYKWPDKEGACPVRVGIQIYRLQLLTNTEPDDFIVKKLIDASAGGT